MGQFINVLVFLSFFALIIHISSCENKTHGRKCWSPRLTTSYKISSENVKKKKVMALWNISWRKFDKLKKQFRNVSTFLVIFFTADGNDFGTKFEKSLSKFSKNAFLRSKFSSSQNNGKWLFWYWWLVIVLANSRRQKHLKSWNFLEDDQILPKIVKETN